jgi:hypothetical protein
VSEDRRSALAQRLLPAAAEAPAPAPAPAAPARVPAPARPPAPAPAAGADDENDDGRDRFTYYIDEDLGNEFEEKAHALFWDARGELKKGDIYSAVIRAGLDRWDEVHRELWARTKRAER